MGEQGVLELRRSKRLLRVLAGVGLVGVVGQAPGLLWPKGTGFLVVTAISVACALWFAGAMLLAAARVDRPERIVRIGSDGVELPGAGLVPWSDLAEVREVQLKRDKRRMIVFLLRPGVVLPPSGSPGRTGRRAQWVRNSLQRQYGSPMVINPLVYAIRPAALLDALRPFSPVPVVPQAD